MTFQTKPLWVKKHCILGLIKQIDLLKFTGTRYVVLFGPGWDDAIYNMIRYLISVKNGITDIINHNFARIRIDSYNSLPKEKILIFHNVIILINSVVNKKKNIYYYNIFLEKGLYRINLTLIF